MRAYTYDPFTVPASRTQRTEIQVTGTAMGVLMGGYYERITVALPTDFISIGLWSGTGRADTGGGVIYGLWFTGSNVQFDLLTNQNSTTCYYSLDITGTWK